MAGLPEPWVGALFAAFCGLGFVALTAWGFTLRALALRLERRHPDWAAALRARSRKKAARLALVSELQNALFAAEAPPPEVAADAGAARLIAREARLRRLFVPLALAAFAVYALG